MPEFTTTPPIPYVPIGDQAAAVRSAINLGSQGESISPVPLNARFVTEGDSITAATVEGQTSWVPLAAQMANVAGRTVDNVAVSGSTTTAMIARYATNVYPLRPVGGEVVFLATLIGPNDGAGVNPDTWLTSMEAYWTTAKSDGFTVIAITPLPYDANSKMLDLAGRVRASTVPDRVVDLGAIFAKSDNAITFLSDDLHPTALGAEMIAAEFNRALNFQGPIVGASRLTFASNGIGVGTTTPKAGLHSIQTLALQIGDSTETNIAKVGRFVMQPYGASDAIPFTIISASASATANALNWGGGTGAANAATSHTFYVGANNSTLTGTLAGGISSTGRWAFGANSGNSTSSILSLMETGATLRLSQTTGTQQTSTQIGLPSSNGSITANSLAGELAINSPSGTGISLGTNTTGNTQTVRVRIKDTGVVNLTDAACPTYADDTAADAALSSGDLYRTTAGGRTVFRKP